MYINKINIPPINTRNKIYENQKDWEIDPINIEINKVWINKIIPNVNGWLKFKNIKENKVSKNLSNCNILYII